MGFLAALSDYLKIESVLETGTSFGLTSLYFSSVPSVKKITTIEGSQTLARLAETHFNDYDFEKKISLVNGNLYNHFIPALIKTKPDLVFLDADHRPEAIEFYLSNIKEHAPETSCIVIHDINWSQEMKTTWEAIVQNPAFPLTIDIFHAGLIFPNRTLQKQHFQLRF